MGLPPTAMAIGKIAAPIIGGALSGGSNFPSEHKRDELRRDQELLYRNTRKDARTQSVADIRTFLPEIIKVARSEGINPLTILGTGYGQGAVGGSGVSGGGSPSVPTGSPLSPAQGALAGAANAFMQYDPIAEERRRLENELLEQDIQTAKHQNARFGLQGVRETSSPTTTRSGSNYPVTSAPNAYPPGWQLNDGSGPTQRMRYPHDDNVLLQPDTRDGLPNPVDITSARIEDSQILGGALAGQHVYQDWMGEYRVTRPGFQPAAVNEELFGGGSVGPFVRGSLDILTGMSPVVNFNPETGFIEYDSEIPKAFEDMWPEPTRPRARPGNYTRNRARMGGWTN